MAGQQQLQLQLQVVKGPLQGTVAEFPVKKKVTIGRTKANAFPIKHDTISQRHAFIVCKNGQWLVTDSNSSNGTSINGVSVEPGVPTELRDGDRLGIGPDNELTVKISSAQDEEEKRNVEVDGDGTREEERQEQQELASQGVTLKEYFSHEDELLAQGIESLHEISIREMMEYAEALKKEICMAGGVEYTATS
ncbi:unnamed protein product [Calypogeia fissa]